MSYPDDLIEQARHLIGRHKRRPKQASLRRATSAAYYALFHELTTAAATRAVGTTAPASFAGAVARTFDHRVMRDASADFVKATPPAKLRRLLDGVPVPQDLRDLADAFVVLRVRRHAADYDLVRRLLKADTGQGVDLAEEAVGLCRQLGGDPAFARYLFALHSYDRLRAE